MIPELRPCGGASTSAGTCDRCGGHLDSSGACLRRVPVGRASVDLLDVRLAALEARLAALEAQARRPAIPELVGRIVVDREGSEALVAPCACGGPPSRLGSWDPERRGWLCRLCSGIVTAASVRGEKDPNGTGATT